MFVLKVKLNNKTQSYTSQTSEFVIGRSSDNDVVIASDVISRKHLRIHVTAKNIAIVDLNSANGTFVNDAKIEPLKAYNIVKTDRVRLGNMVDELFIYGGVSEDQKPKSAPIMQAKAPQPANSLQLESSPKTGNEGFAKPVASNENQKSKTDQIIENAKNRAKYIIAQAEENAKGIRAKSMESSEKILRDSQIQSEKIIKNAEELSQLNVNQSKLDAKNIIDMAHSQARLIIEKSIQEGDAHLTEAKRQCQVTLKNGQLEIENLKVAMKKDFLLEQEKEDKAFQKYKNEEIERLKTQLDEEKQLALDEVYVLKEQIEKDKADHQSEVEEFEQYKEKELDDLKKYIFEEKEKTRRENDSKRDDFLKKLIEKEELLVQREKEILKNIEQHLAEIESLEKKKSTAKDEFAQLGLQLKINLDEEKKKLDLDLIRLKEEYNVEIQEYKRRELDKVKNIIDNEAVALQEKKRIQIMQMGFSIKKDIAQILDLEFSTYVSKNELGQVINKVSQVIDRQSDLHNEETSKKAEEPTLVFKEDGNSTKKTKTLRYMGIATCAVLLAVFVLWDKILDSIENGDSYASVMYKKMQIDSVYIPVQTNEWKSTYHERVLYLNRYVDFKTTQVYMDKWTRYLTDVENARQLKLSEDDMIRFIAREVNLINQLSSLQKTIDARQLDIGIEKLRNAEADAKKEFLAIVKSQENLDRLSSWEKKFFTDYMAVSDPTLREPTSK